MHRSHIIKKVTISSLTTSADTVRMRAEIIYKNPLETKLDTNFAGQILTQLDGGRRPNAASMRLRIYREQNSMNADYIPSVSSVPWTYVQDRRHTDGISGFKADDFQSRSQTQPKKEKQTTL